MVYRRSSKRKSKSRRRSTKRKSGRKVRSKSRRRSTKRKSGRKRRSKLRIHRNKAMIGDFTQDFAYYFKPQKLEDLPTFVQLQKVLAKNHGLEATIKKEGLDLVIELYVENKPRNKERFDQIKKMTNWTYLWNLKHYPITYNTLPFPPHNVEPDSVIPWLDPGYHRYRVRLNENNRMSFHPQEFKYPTSKVITEMLGVYNPMLGGTLGELYREARDAGFFD